MQRKKFVKSPFLGDPDRKRIHGASVWKVERSGTWGESHRCFQSGREMRASVSTLKAGLWGRALRSEVVQKKFFSRSFQRREVCSNVSCEKQGVNYLLVGYQTIQALAIPRRSL